MKKFLLSTLLFIGGILGSIQAEGPVFQWAKSLDGNPGNGGDNAHSLIKSSDGKILALAQFGSKKDNDPVYYGDDIVGYGCATQANSDNCNIVLLKLDSDGSKIWSLYSFSGDVSISSSSIAATSDGGAVLALKMRYASGMTDKTPAFKDAKNNTVTISKLEYRLPYILCGSTKSQLGRSYRMEQIHRNRQQPRSRRYLLHRRYTRRHLPLCYHHRREREHLFSRELS